MPLPLVGAKLVLQGNKEFDRTADRAHKKVGLISKALGGMGSAGVHGGSMVTGALTAMMGPIGIVAQGAFKIGKAFVGMAAEGGQLRGINIVFDNLTQSYGLNADLLDRLRVSTKGAVDDFELMRQVNKALVGAGDDFGKMFGEKLPLLMQVSREAAKAQGQSVEYMFDSIVTGIKRSSPMILDNLGFQFSLTEANEKYAESIGKTVKELSKEEKQIALLNAVTESSAKLIEQTGGSVDTAAKQALAWRTALTNLRKYMSVELEPILTAFMGIIGKPGSTEGITGAILGATKAIVGKIVPAIEEFGYRLREFISGIGDVIGILGDLRNYFGFVVSDGDTLNDWLSHLPDSIRPLARIFAETFNIIRGTIQNVMHAVQWDEWMHPSEFISGFSSMPKQLQKIIQTVLDVARPLATWIDAIDFGGMIKQIKGLASQIIPAFGKSLSRIDFGNIINQVIAFGERVVPIIRMVMGMMSPLGLIFAGMQKAGVEAFEGIWESLKPVLTNLVELVINTFNMMSDIFDEVWPQVEQTVSIVFEAITDVIALFITDIIPLLLDGFNMFLTFINKHMPEFSALISKVFGIISKIILQVVSMIVPFIIDMFTKVVKWTKANWPLIQKTIEKVLEFIWKIVKTILTLIVKFWDAHGERIMSIVEKVWNIIKTIISTVLDVILAVIKAIMQMITGDWEGAWETIKGITDTLWEGIKTVISLALDLLVNDIIPLAMDAISNIIETAWEWIKTTTTTLWEGIKTVIKEKIDDAKTAVENTVKGLWTSLERLWRMIKEKAAEMWESVKATIIGKIQSAVDGVMELAKEFLKAGAQIVENIKRGIDNAWGAFKDWFARKIADLLSILPWRSPPDDPTSPLQHLEAAGEGIVKNIMQGMGRVIPLMRSQLAGAFASQSSAIPMLQTVQNITNFNYEGASNNYSLTTQSATRPGALALEFQAMEMLHV